jgi:hypothetical protein
MTGRIYIIGGPTPNEFIINVAINGNATNTILVKRRKLSIEFVEASNFIFKQITKTKVCVTNVNIWHNISKIDIIYPFIIADRYMSFPDYTF